MMTGAQAARRLKKIVHLLLVATFAVVLVGIVVASAFGGTTQAGTGAAKAPADPEVLKALISNVGGGLIAASIVAGLGAIAAGIAVAYVGAAAVGAVSEKPEVFGRTIIFVALGEGIAVLGLVISILILNTVGEMVAAVLK
jgi:V/A-type H+-transporting ATPase subunit K